MVSEKTPPVAVVMGSGYKFTHALIDGLTSCQDAEVDVRQDARQPGPSPQANDGQPTATADTFTVTATNIILNVLDQVITADTLSIEQKALPGGGSVIDSPGIKVLGLWQVEKEELISFYPEMVALQEGCRFTGCTHTHEPDCAVKAAVAAGAEAAQKVGELVSYHVIPAPHDMLEDILLK